MKALRITTNGVIDIISLTKPLYKSAGEIVGGLIEHVRPRYLDPGYCMLCNETGLIDNLPINPIASFLYGYIDHKQPIAGDVIILREEENDWCGLNFNEIFTTSYKLLTIKYMLEVINNGEEK